MSEWSGVGRALIVAGVALAAIGAVIAFGPRLPWLGRLPGDFVWRGNGWAVYAPLGTCLLVSVVMSLLLGLFSRR
jgi:DUF2905 family protein